MGTWKCKNCRSTDVEAKEFIKLNGGKTTNSFTGDDCDTWCCSCEQHAGVVYIEDAVPPVQTGNQLQLEEEKSMVKVGELLSYQQREDLLVTALEGGSNYWYFLPDTSMCDQSSITESALVLRIMKAVDAGASVPVHDAEDHKDLLGHFNMEGICKGEALMKARQPSHWENIDGESWDAETADVWFQFCVLGDIVYS